MSPERQLTSARVAWDRARHQHKDAITGLQFAAALYAERGANPYGPEARKLARAALEMAARRQERLDAGLAWRAAIRAVRNRLKTFAA